MLKNIPLFSYLRDEEIKAVGKIAVRELSPKNTTVIAEGETSDSLYVVLGGKAVATRRDGTGRSVLLNVFEKHDYFGEMSFLDGEPRCATVETRLDSEFLVVPNSEFRQIATENPDVMFHLMRGLLQKIRKATEQVEIYAFGDVYRRIVYLFNDLEDRDGIIDEHLTNAEIAARIGASEKMAGRVMKELLLGEYIGKEKRKIRIRKKLPEKF